MIAWLGKVTRSFGCAIAGLLWLVRTQRNARIHLAASVLVISAGVISHLDRIEWALIALAIAMVFAAEALNTAVEHLADRITTQTDEHIRRAKDLAAGAVLAAAAAAAILGGCVFWPHWNLR